MAVSEAAIREITRKAIEELGHLATPDNVRQVVDEAISRLEGEVAPLAESGLATSRPPGSGITQVIVTVFGKNQAGVLADVSRCIADFNANVVEISQKILQDWFTMIMIIELDPARNNFFELKAALAKVGEKLGARVLAQHEDVFNSMHRL
jgi:ACT domain-containing protein